MDNSAIADYIKDFIQEKNPIISEIEQKSRAAGVPIMQPVAMLTLLQLLRIKNSKRLLEIGTAVGYSSIKMAMCNPDLTIVTVERDDEMYNQACDNIERMGLSKRINIVHGDALDVSDKIQELGPYDTLFIDAAKAQYKRFFDLYTPMVKDEGLILTDNILFRGLVAEDSEKIENRRIKRLVEKINEYNSWLMNHPIYQTVLLPIDDGLAITIKSGSPRSTT